MADLHWAQMIAVSIGMGIGGMILTTYRRWKENRAEIEVSQNWRGEWITDRKVKLFERWLWVAFFVSIIASFYLGFYYDWS